MIITAFFLRQLMCINALFPLSFYFCLFSRKEILFMAAYLTFHIFFLVKEKIPWASYLASYAGAILLQWCKKWPLAVLCKQGTNLATIICLSLSSLPFGVFVWFIVRSLYLVYPVLFLSRLSLLRVTLYRVYSLWK